MNTQNDERHNCDPPAEEPDELDMDAAEQRYWEAVDRAWEEYKASGERARRDRRR